MHPLIARFRFSGRSADFVLACLAVLSFLAGVAIPVLASSTTAAGAERPITGDSVKGFDGVDTAITTFMDRIGCQAATVAISREGRLVYSRGYGWSDEAKTKPTPPNALMRIASVTKPITAAAVKNAIREKLIDADAKAFELIGIRPRSGEFADPRIGEVAVSHLLSHQGGWDRSAAFDPMFRTSQIEKTLSLKRPATAVDVIEFMTTQPLQFSPGEKSVYSNFGYCVLGRALEKGMKRPYAECVQKSICEPLGIRDIQLGYGSPEKRHPRETWYPVAEGAFSFDVMDSHGGLIASAPALCQFLEGYWLNGEPRKRGEQGDWTFFGSLPGTTAMVRQRTTGANIALLLNGRRDSSYGPDNDLLKRSIDAAVDAADLRK